MAYKAPGTTTNPDWLTKYYSELEGGRKATAAGGQYDGMIQAERQKAKRAKLRQNRQVVAEVGDDFTSLASKLGIDAGALANANPDTNKVSAGAAYNVPRAIPPGVGAGAGTGLGDAWEDFKDKIVPWGGEGEPETFYDWGMSLGGGQNAWDWINWEGKKNDSVQGSLPPGVGQGAGIGLTGKMASPAYNPPPPTGTPDWLTDNYDALEAGRMATRDVETGTRTPSQPAVTGHGIWKDHDYWTGHVDPYRLAIDLATEQGIELPPHPSENLDAYRYSSDFASNYLRDIREWEDYVYGGQRQDMVSLLRNDEVLMDKLFSGELTTGDLLEVHREFPAYNEQYGFEIRDQTDLDILEELGYIEGSGGGYGYGGYSPGSYGGSRGYSGASSPYRGLPASYLSLTNWSI